MAKIYTLTQRVPVSAVLSISSELIMQLDKSLWIIFANDPFITFLSATSKDLFGKNIEYSPVFSVFEDIYGEFVDRIKEGIAGTEWMGELVLKERGVTFSCRIAPTVFDNGQKGVSVILEDISERKRAEKALRESEGKLNAMLQSISDHMSMMDKDLNIIWANETAKRYFGKDLVGRKCYEVYHQRQNPCEPYPCITLKAFQDGEIHRHETPVIDIHGQMRFFECSANVALNNECGRPVAVLEISRDITEHKQMENALQESEEKYRTLVERANDGICIIQDSIIKFCNPAIAAFWGGSEEKILGRNFSDFIHPDALGKVIKRHTMRMSGETVPSQYETILKRKDGSRFFAEVNAGICPFEGKSANHVVIRDVNDRKQAEDALKKSEERFRDLINTTADMVWQTDADSRFTYVSPQIETILGYTPEELVGHTPFEFLEPASVESCRLLFKTAIRTHQQVILHESRWIDRDGNIVVMESHATPVYNSDGTCAGFRGIDRDITDR